MSSFLSSFLEVCWDDKDLGVRRVEHSRTADGKNDTDVRHTAWAALAQDKDNEDTSVALLVLGG